MNNFADFIIRGAQVYTVDEKNPQASAVAVKGKWIVYVGDDAGVEAWRGPQTQCIDGEGRTVLPGFIDSHFHLMHGAVALADMQLYQVQTLDDLRTAVQTFARENPELPWLRGQGLRYGIPTPNEPLTRQHLDAIEAQRPLVLLAYDVHTAWANTTALQRAGLLHGGPPLPGGAEIVMGEDGLATGELFEGPAYDPLLAQIPEPDEAARRKLMGDALSYLASLGVTSVHNMDGDPEQTAFYAALADAQTAFGSGELTVRVYMPYSVKPETPLEALAQEAASMRDRFQSDMVRAGAVKFFMDGVYESYTAVSLSGYPDQPYNAQTAVGLGRPIFDAEHFARMVSEADRLGLQIFTHACGDGAVRLVLDGYETAQANNGRRDSRHRVEHIEMIHLDDAPRFAQLGVIASMQPLHVPLPEKEAMDVWPARVREQDWDRAFAWRTLRDAGASMAFGSDWPVALPDPILGIAAAVNRRPWRPGQISHKQTLEEAIAAYTRDAAYAEFQEGFKGQIRAGMVADLVLLTDNIFAAAAEELAAVRVAMTLCDGRIVYERR
jgi:predicted amidohydrolase YtcJ